MNFTHPSRLLLATLVAVLASCGAAPPVPEAHREPSYTEVHRVPFHVTLPNGTVIALEESGAMTIDGDTVATLQSDGRVEDADGETLAALLPDGRLSFEGELTEATVSAGHLVEHGVAILELDQDRSLTLRSPDGAELATVPVVGVVPESRETVLFVVAVHLLSHARDREEADAPADDIVRIRVPVDGRPARGSATAPVTIAIFTDFQCPFCARAVPTLERLRAEYGERIRFVLFHRPLPFHDHAEDAATLAEEALAQRGPEAFWAMHDLLFAHSDSLERADLLQYAGQLGLDVARVRTALDGDVHRARLAADEALATRVGARGTPTFFVNGIPVVGAQPIEVFRTQIDAELVRVEQLVRRGVAPGQVYARLMVDALADAPPEAAPAPAPARRQPDPDAVYRVPIDGAPARGPDDALVTIVMFSDFQCPFCSRVLPTLERIRTTYGADVRIVFRENPLPFHDNAGPAAEAALEAYAQRGDDGFWRMHDLLFESQDALTREDLESYAAELHLDMRRFRRALDGHAHTAAIEADQQLARSLGATGTPAFFINGRNLRGAQPFESFAAVIDAELARARERVAAGTPRRQVYEATTRGGATAPVLIEAPDAPDVPAAAPPDADRVYVLPVPPGAPSRGAVGAPVTIQMFSDFQCPFCSRVLPTVEALLTQYAGRVRFVWRNYPLPFHQSAQLAAEAAMEVYAQRGADAFWAYHDSLFDNQRALAREDLETYAAEIPGLDLRRFRAALDDHRHRAEVEADMAAVRQAGAEIGTPSFFVNGRLLQGAQPIESFRALIDRVLAE